MSIVPMINGQTAIPCTGCRYCVEHCINKIPIPDYFKMYNEIVRYPEDDWKIEPSYSSMAQNCGKASDCVSCRSCEKHCPQKIRIADFMKDVARRFD